MNEKLFGEKHHLKAFLTFHRLPVKAPIKKAQTQFGRNVTKE